MKQSSFQRRTRTYGTRTYGQPATSITRLPLSRLSGRYAQFSTLVTTCRKYEQVWDISSRIGSARVMFRLMAITRSPFTSSSLEILAFVTGHYVARMVIHNLEPPDESFQPTCLLELTYVRCWITYGRCVRSFVHNRQLVARPLVKPAPWFSQKIMILEVERRNVTRRASSTGL